MSGSAQTQTALQNRLSHIIPSAALPGAAPGFRNTHFALRTYQYNTFPFKKQQKMYKYASLYHTFFQDGQTAGNESLYANSHLPSSAGLPIRLVKSLFTLTAVFVCYVSARIQPIHYTLSRHPCLYMANLSFHRLILLHHGALQVKSETAEKPCISICRPKATLM